MAGLVEKFKEMWTPSDDNYEDDYEEQEENYEEDSHSEYRDGKNSHDHRVLSIHSNAKVKVVLVKPEHFGEEIKNIADELLKMNTIVLNLEEVAKAESRRMIDFLSGAAYAIGGKIKKVSTDTFVLTPRNVDLEGDAMLDELENYKVCF